MDGNISLAQTSFDIVEEPPNQPTATPPMKPTTTPSTHTDEKPSENGNMGLLFIIGMIVLAVILFGGGGLVFWLVYRRKPKAAPTAQGIQFNQPGVIQDQHGNYWYQDPNTHAWYYWDGRTWELDLSKRTIRKAI